jgi:hypothetical protein
MSGIGKNFGSVLKNHVEIYGDTEKHTETPWTGCGLFLDENDDHGKLTFSNMTASFFLLLPPPLRPLVGAGIFLCWFWKG